VPHDQNDQLDDHNEDQILVDQLTALGMAIGAIRAEPGTDPRVLVYLDSAHESMTRSVSTLKGEEEPEVVRWYGHLGLILGTGVAAAWTVIRWPFKVAREHGMVTAASVGTIGLGAVMFGGIATEWPDAGDRPRAAPPAYSAPPVVSPEPSPSRSPRQPEVSPSLVSPAPVPSPTVAASPSPETEPVTVEPSPTSPGETTPPATETPTPPPEDDPEMRQRCHIRLSVVGLISVCVYSPTGPPGEVS
jgi:hypothetical protein